MRIFTEKRLREYAETRPEARIALQEWCKAVRRGNWTCFADLKQRFRHADYIGNQRYVFNVKGNQFRIVAIVRFTVQYVYIRFIGTHEEYDRVDCLNI